MEEPIYNSYVDVKVTVVAAKVDELKRIKKELKALKDTTKKGDFRGSCVIVDTDDIDPDAMSWARIMNLILSGGWEHANDRLTFRTHNSAIKPMMTIKVSLELQGSKLADRLLSRPVENFIEEIKLMYNCEVASAAVEVRKYRNNFEQKFSGLPKVIKSIRKVCN